jgi:hypothetical protein
MDFLQLSLKNLRLYDRIKNRMKNKFITFAATLLLTSGVCQMPSFLSQQSEAYQVVMNNRILTKINGKTLSVMDVKKKMDLFLNENHPESFSSNLLLYQFYSQHWRPTLQEMIENELIKMEAVTFNINISEGDIRQEMDKRFGPNLVKRLDEISLTYDDAKDLIRDDIIVRNMTWFRIWSKVLHDVTPETIKGEYDTYITKLPLKDEWVYKMATVRSPDNSAEAAKDAYAILLTSGDAPFKQEGKGFTGLLPQNASLNVSEPITVSSKDLAPEVLMTLESLPLNTYSEPVPQKSRSDGSTVYRMFYAIEHKKDKPPTFEEVSSKINETLIQRYGDKERDEYFHRLRKKFLSEDLVVKTLFPPNYQPFALSGS